MAAPREKDKDNSKLMEKIVSLCKRRGFIFQSSEIYGGINGFWDYGPLGAELKRNLRDAWWRAMTREREDVLGLDATIIMHPDIWKASGHVDTFCDMMVDCKKCKGRFRADHIDDISCPEKPSKCVGECDGEKTEPRPFNLMFKTHTGPLESEDNVAYLRPETAQAIFAQFKNVLDTSRQKVPFGICQIGKAFRNEITPKNFTFRSREFEQMELEFFIKPDEAIEAVCGEVTTWSEGADLSQPQDNWGWEMWHRYWVDQRTRFYDSIGLGADVLSYYWQTEDDLAHYSKACVDILFKFPFGADELEGIAARGDFDLSQHQKHSGKSQEFFDEKLKTAVKEWDEDKQREFTGAKVAKALGKLAGAKEEERAECEKATRHWCERFFKGWYVPHVIEPSAGLDRMALAILCAAFDEQEKTDAKGKVETIRVMRISPIVAPIKVGVFPLLKNKPELVEKARGVFQSLKKHLNCFYDETGAIGRRYARQDEAGTPYCLTIDFETLGDCDDVSMKDTVTVRHRDSNDQERIAINELLPWLLARVQ
jgi:glycyl-tRNA synthetase